MGCKGRLLGASVLVLSGLAAGQADAQATARALGGDGATVGEVVVTAQKREQRLVEVPVAVTALSGNTLWERGVTDI